VIAQQYGENEIDSSDRITLLRRNDTRGTR
jgi:hypothetical protein